MSGLGAMLTLWRVPPACTAGAAVIFVDAIVRLFPGKHRFRIAESNIFLACSLSLSFGIMVSYFRYPIPPASEHDR